MIAELEQIIQTEEAKPEAERDVGLIDDCIHEIAELKGVRADYSDEEVKEITDKLIKKIDREKRKKRLIRYIAGIAAVFVLVGGVSACAINPALVNWFIKIAHMPLGTSLKAYTVTYTNQGREKQYQNIRDLIEIEGINIYYPSALPDDVYIQRIDAYEQDDCLCYVYKFTNADIHFTVEMQSTAPMSIQKPLCEINTNELHFFVISDSGTDSYISVAEHANTKYILQASNLDDIILIIGGLKRRNG
jgi:hypothetical protein